MRRGSRGTLFPFIHSSEEWMNGKSVPLGFTLVEVMVAMGILVVGMSTVLGLLSFALSLHRTSAERAESALALEAVVGELRANAFAIQKNGEAGEPQEIRQQLVPSHDGLLYSARFRENPKLSGEYLVELDISWKEKGRLRSQSYRTILSQEIPFEERMKRLPRK